MKIRTGFVSNSSSSSFVAIANRDIYDKIHDGLSKPSQLIADMIFKKKEGFVYGQILSGNIGEYFIEDLEGKKEYEQLIQALKEDIDDIHDDEEIRGIITDEVYNFENEISSLLRREDKNNYLIDGMEL